MNKITLLFSLVLVLMVSADEKKEFSDRYLSDRYDVSDINISKKDLNVEELQNIKKTVKEPQKEVKDGIRRAKSNKEFQKEVKDIRANIKSKEFQKSVYENKKYLINDKELGYRDSIKKYTKVNVQKILDKTVEQLDQNQNTTDEKVYIFISSSLNKSLIQNYFKRLENVNTEVTFILRGLVGGAKKVMPTMLWIKDILTKKDGTSYAFDIWIDPEKTLKHKIDRVPAILYTNDGEDFIAYGGVDVGFAIKKISLDTNAIFLKNLHKKIENSQL